MNDKNPPTYAEAVAAETSHAGPSRSRGGPSPPNTTEPTPEQQRSHHDDEKQLSRLHEYFHALNTRLGRPLSKIASKMRAEGWLPGSLEQECDKAARVLRSFTCTAAAAHPFHRSLQRATPLTTPPTTVDAHGRAAQIPPAVLARCAGLAVLHLVRTGPAATGSGVVVARLPSDGGWSAPSACFVSAACLGAGAAASEYDCVCVLNTPDQVAAFTRARLSAGGEAPVAGGPSSLDAAAELERTAKPVWSYVMSHGRRAGVQIESTLAVVRAEANAAFYGEAVEPGRILAGEVAWPKGKGGALRDVLEAVDEKDAEHRTAEEEKAGLARSGY